MAVRHYTFWAVLCGILLVGCSLGPTAGTETGNPDITACLNAASGLFDTSGLWNPSTYLTEGEQQLNPERIMNSWGNPVVAKRKTASSTETSRADTTRFSVITRVDTIIVIDTQLINDTIITDTVVENSFRQATPDTSDSSLLMTRFIRHDSIYVQDTIIRADTTYFSYTDTIWQSETAAGGVMSNDIDMPKSIIIQQDAVPVRSDDYIVLRDSVTGEIAEVQSVVIDSAGTVSYEKVLTPEIHTGLSYLTVSQQTTANGTTISESYQYTLPGAQYSIPAPASSTGVAMSKGTIVYTNATSRISLDIDFDAGNDQAFATTGDNRILALERSTITGTTQVDMVRYGWPYFGMRQDTLFLQRDQVAPNDSVAIQHTNYTCIGGTDHFDHRQNRLVSVYREIGMKNRAIKKITIAAQPDHPLENGERSFSCTLGCTVDFGKGLTGLVDAVADFVNKTITGTYAQAGVEYSFTYSMVDQKIEMIPLQ